MTGYNGQKGSVPARNFMGIRRGKMAIKIVTDSGADIPIELVKSLGITVVPLTLSFGEQTYLDGVDLSPDEFYEKSRIVSILF